MKDELQQKATELSRDLAEGTRSVVRTTWRIVKWAIVLALVAGGLTGWFVYTANYSEGSRSGRLIKISKKGVIFKTWEGQLDVGGISGGGPTGEITSLWEFTVPANETGVLEKLDRHSGKKVKIYYAEKYFQLFWRGDTKYFASRVEALE
ncbi:MAG: 6-phosphogluconate dehydrogenase [bacterium]|nr:6-phosphogluconate dehydrogenase [bacterium]